MSKPAHLDDLEDAVLKAIDNYVKHESCAFLEWAISEGWQPYDGHDRWIFGRKVLGTKNLYELFNSKQ